MKNGLIKFAFYIGRYSSVFYPRLLSLKIENFIHFINSGRVSKELLASGYPIEIRYPSYIKGGEYISIGNRFRASYRFRLEAWDQYKNERYFPRILIGDDVSFSDNCHVGAIGSVRIGNHVLFGSNVYIADHFHGEVKSIEISPLNRPLFYKGAVVIEDNVWVGDGVCIMPNVSIGRGCVVGANSVVTKSFPPGCVIAGSPARIIKEITD